MAAVSYLNTVPLIWGMLHGRQRGLFELSFCVPSECSLRLEQGSADIGIVPSADLPRLGLEILRGAGIACRGAVRSILLISRRPLPQVRTLAADTSSRTSVQLARILLRGRYGSDPALVPSPPELTLMLAEADAAVMIGDPALRLNLDGLPFTVVDLGAEWVRWTGLPMVFAVWACRPELKSDELEEAFVDSCRYGLHNLDEIVAQEARARGLEPAFARDYLAHKVCLELGAAEYAGLECFLEHLAALPAPLILNGVPRC